MWKTRSLVTPDPRVTQFAPLPEFPTRLDGGRKHRLRAGSEEAPQPLGVLRLQRWLVTDQHPYDGRGVTPDLAIVGVNGIDAQWQIRVDALAGGVRHADEAAGLTGLQERRAAERTRAAGHCPIDLAVTRVDLDANRLSEEADLANRGRPRRVVVYVDPHRRPLSDRVGGSEAEQEPRALAEELDALSDRGRDARNGAYDGEREGKGVHATKRGVFVG